MSSKKITIAIDGYSSCGKSTLAKALANHFGYIFIDTGAMYRAVTLFAMRNKLVGHDFLKKEELIDHLNQISLRFERNSDSEKLEILLNGEAVENEIRSMEVSNLVSKVSTIKEVREKLVLEQQAMGKEGGVIMDGRDIGSVVFPHAELKLFITADPDIRAKRRFDELKQKGDSVSLEEVKSNLLARDLEDSTRKESPLIQTNDARVIDNSHLSIEEQFELAKKWVLERIEA